MKENKLTVKINEPVQEVFIFTTDPKNTPLWVDDCIKEETNEWPVKMGSIYKNQNKASQWREYMVTAFQENKVFELTSKDKNYHVKYTYTPINENTSKLEYFEWVDKGSLDMPFTQNDLNKLKSVLESS